MGEIPFDKLFHDITGKTLFEISKQEKGRNKPIMKATIRKYTTEYSSLDMMFIHADKKEVAVYIVDRSDKLTTEFIMRRALDCSFSLYKAGKKVSCFPIIDVMEDVLRQYHDNTEKQEDELTPDCIDYWV